MKIHIDINHPAHVHYFRNLIKVMEKEGYSFVITNRDSKIINQLLDYYNIDHIIRNKRPEKQSLISSILYLIGMIRYCIRYSIKNKPDIYLGFAATQCAITSFFFRKPCIILDDTEHNNMNHALYKRFCSVVLTPFYFKKKLGDKQIFFQAYVEQLYLHNKYYNPDNSVLFDLGLDEKTPYALVRYISYNATHDSKVEPIPSKIKKEFIRILEKKMKVFVSLESGVKDDFYDKYKLQISPEKMHDLIGGASVFLSEGATMASEAGILGVPYIYCNPLQVGNIQQQAEDFPEMAVNTTHVDEIKSMLNKKIINSDQTEQKRIIREKIEETTINPTDFLVWFVENYPQSADIMKKNSDYQYNFK